jgi:hypothetical protein
MIPPKNDPCWNALVTGKNQHQFKMAALAMCVARIQRQAKQGPQTIQQGIEDIHAFCCKFETLVASDVSSAFNLERV